MKNKIKLLVLDLDHTTLLSYKKFSQLNLWKLKQAQQNNLNIMFITGKHLVDSIDLSVEANIDKNFGYLIANDGSVIYNLKNKKFLRNEYILKNIVKKVYDFVIQNKFFCVLVDGNNDKFLAKKPILMKWLFKCFGYKLWGRNLNTYPIKKDFFNSEFFTDNFFYKILIFDKNIFKLEKFCILLEEKFPNLSVKLYPKWFLIQILPKVNKFEALEVLLKKTNISINEVMAVGNGMNDYELLKNVKYSVAVKNSHFKILQISKILIPHYKNDAIAYLIDKYFLTKD